VNGMQKGSVNQTKKEDEKVVTFIKMVYNYSIKQNYFSLKNGNYIGGITNEESINFSRI
jgi:hypothetical protein